MAGAKYYGMIAGYAAGERGARAAAREGTAVVVVDAFRASTTIAVFVRKGARVIPVASIEEAVDYAGPTAVSGSVAARKCGASFWELADRDRGSGTAPGAMVVPSTTNGTRIIEVAQGAFAILAGAFVNSHTVADELAVGAYGERVAVIGCGWEGGRASEDESAAGAILCRLRQRGVGLDERVRRVVELYLRAPRRRCAGTAPLDVSHASGTGGIPISASPRIPCRSSLFSKALPSRAGGRGVLAVGPNRGGGKRLDIRQKYS